MSDQPVDLEVLRSFVGEDPRDVSASLALFAESTEKARMELRQAERAGDAALVGAVAHRFKSTALYLGAAALAAACARLERAGAAKDLASIRTESPTFDSEVDRVLAAVTALRTRSETSPEHAR